MFKKSNTIYLFVICLLTGMTFQSCFKDECDATQTFIQHEPIYKTVDEIRKDIQILPARNLENPGNLYYYNEYILVNEQREGVHIIDNKVPENPVNVAFIQIPGNVDMAVKNNILYADNYIDLLAIDISDPTNPVLQARTEDVFQSFDLHTDLGHLVYYEETEVTMEVNCNDPRWGSGGFWLENSFFSNRDIDFAFPAADSNQSSGGNGGGFGTNTPVGVGGSMASFTIYGCYLYAIDEADVDVFDITNPMADLVNTFTVSWDIETLFPYGDKLFIGSEAGMFIYDNSDPINPTFLSEFQHSRACDPVFVNGKYAYVTLRSGTWCQGFTNQLDVINIEDLTNPYEVASYPMDNPHGLSIKDDILYLCEGESGLKVFDIEDVNNIDNNRIDHVKDFNTYDAISIPNKDVLLVVGEDGLYQFDTSEPKNLKEISVIAVDGK